MTVRLLPDATEDSLTAIIDHRLHKPGVASSSLAAASEVSDCVIDHSPNDEYHRRRGVSASQLKELALSPVAFYTRYVVGEAPPKSSEALTYGSLLHLWGELGDDLFWSRVQVAAAEVLTATGQFGKAAKEWAASLAPDAIPLSPPDQQKLWLQTRQILANRAAREAINGSVDREFNIAWKWRGHDCRCRVDGATEKFFYDFKTTSDVEPKYTFHSSVKKWRYDIQAAMYGAAAVAAGWEPHSMVFIITSTVAPYHCHVARLPDALVAKGRRRCLALLEELQRRKEWDCWLPDDYGEIHELFVPRYMLQEGSE